MSDVNKLNDDQLAGVSGGAKTAYGFDQDANGTVAFHNGTGTMAINKADWDWLMTQYKGPTLRDKEYQLSTVPIKDIQSILNEHHAGRM
ncbi:MAG: hypothetical protein J6O70_03660 [Lachnospiraceae bacterium]|nr:hypothetical protein [Lachnospiraceae bacterium]